MIYIFPHYCFLIKEFLTHGIDARNGNDQRQHEHARHRVLRGSRAVDIHVDSQAEHSVRQRVRQRKIRQRHKSL